METLSFVGKSITLRQQFFQELDLCGFTAQVTLSGLSAVPLRNAIQAQVGPVSKMYGFIHDLGQKVSIPEINGAPVALNLPNHHDLCNRESAWRKTQTQNSWRDNDEADRLFKLRQGYLGFVKTGADGMLNQGLFALFDAVVLVCRKDMMVQEDIPMSAITDVSLTEDSKDYQIGCQKHCPGTWRAGGTCQGCKDATSHLAAGGTRKAQRAYDRQCRPRRGRVSTMP